MNELIDGEKKIVIAQRAVHELVASLPAETRLGLVAYSHRRPGCDDIELLMPPGPLDKPSLLAAVDKLKPKGQTPLSAALRFAVDALGVKQERATVILLSDGLETCGGDPCLTANELSRDHPGLIIHAVGFDLGAREGKKLACIAAAAKGRFLQANDAASLKDALGFVVAEATAPPAPPPAEVLTPATLKVPSVVLAGAQFTAEWTGPNNPGDYLTIVHQGTPDDTAENVAYCSQGSPLGLAALLDAGPAEVRYVSSQSLAVLARAPIEILAVDITLVAPDEALAGSAVSVEWSGAGNDRDYLTIVPKSAPDDEYVNVERATPGAAALVRAPIDPGDCEIRFLSARGRRVLARRPIRIVPATITLEAPAETVAGAVVVVAWSGPGNPQDVLMIVPRSADDSIRGNAGLLSPGVPGRVTAPMEPGDGEIRYVSGQGQRVLARRPIKIIPATTLLEAPAEAVAGATVVVEWKGPGNAQDMLMIVPRSAGDAVRGHAGLAYPGGPARVTAPMEPGDYEIRYLSGQGQRVLARRPITIVAATIALQAPEVSVAGAMVAVAWTGPGNANDVVMIVPRSAGDAVRGNAGLLHPGAPARVAAPMEPGDCEIRYVSGQGQRVLARRPIRIVAAVVALTAPAEVVAGAPVVVEWTGPGNARDVVMIVPRSAGDAVRGNAGLLYPGAPARVTAPIEPGDCEIRYVSGQGSQVLARRPIRIVAAIVTLAAPAEAAAGSVVAIEWTGPGNANDAVTIVAKGAADNVRGTAANARPGGPVRITAPKTAGDYEIRYLAGQGQKVLARRPLRIVAGP